MLIWAHKKEEGDELIGPASIGPAQKKLESIYSFEARLFKKELL